MPKKPSPKTLKAKADRLISLIVRSRGFCERCGRGPSEVTLQCAHIFSRKYIAIRWSEKNLMCLCSGCHMWSHRHPVENMLWLEERFGLDYLKDLRTQAQEYAGRVSRVDYEELVADLQARWNEIEEAA